MGKNIFAGSFQYGSTGGVYLSTDNGTSWNLKDSGLTDHQVNILASSGSNLFAGTNSALFFSNNSGVSWSEILIGTVSAIYISDSNLIVGINNDGIWRLPLTELVTEIASGAAKEPPCFELKQNYSNPFNPTTVISYQLANDGLVTLKVYDILGKEVKTLVNGYKTAWNYSVSFDASKLASGVYIYQLRAGNFISTKKMLLLK